MPNQRAENKQLIAAWINAETREELKKIAKHKGVDLSDVIKTIIEKEIQHHAPQKKRTQSKGPSHA